MFCTTWCGSLKFLYIDFVASHVCITSTPKTKMEGLTVTIGDVTAIVARLLCRSSNWIVITYKYVDSTWMVRESLSFSKYVAE